MHKHISALSSSRYLWSKRPLPTQPNAKRLGHARTTPRIRVRTQREDTAKLFKPSYGFDLNWCQRKPPAAAQRLPCLRLCDAHLPTSVRGSVRLSRGTNREERRCRIGVALERATDRAQTHAMQRTERQANRPLRPGWLPAGWQRAIPRTSQWWNSSTAEIRKPPPSPSLGIIHPVPCLHRLSGLHRDLDPKVGSSSKQANRGIKHLKIETYSELSNLESNNYP